MPTFKSKLISWLILLMVGLGVYFFFFYEKVQPLPEHFAKVQCGTDGKTAKDFAFVNTEFVDYSISTLCYPSDELKNKAQMKCDSFEPKICDESKARILQYYTHLTNPNSIIIGAHRKKDDLPNAVSQVMYAFYQDNTADANANESVQMADDVKAFDKQINQKLILPEKFTLVQPFHCSAQVSILGSAICTGVIKFHSLNIRPAIQVFGDPNEMVSADKFANEINGWLMFADLLVTDK